MTIKLEHEEIIDSTILTEWIPNIKVEELQPISSTTSPTTRRRPIKRWPGDEYETNFKRQKKAPKIKSKPIDKKSITIKKKTVAKKTAIPKPVGSKDPHNCPICNAQLSSRRAVTRHVAR